MTKHIIPALFISLCSYPSLAMESTEFERDKKQATFNAYFNEKGRDESGGIIDKRKNKEFNDTPFIKYAVGGLVRDKKAIDAIERARKEKKLPVSKDITVEASINRLSELSTDSVEKARILSRRNSTIGTMVESEKGTVNKIIPTIKKLYSISDNNNEYQERLKKNRVSFKITTSSSPNDAVETLVDMVEALITQFEKSTKTPLGAAQEDGKKEEKPTIINTTPRVGLDKSRDDVIKLLEGMLYDDPLLTIGEAIKLLKK